MSEEKNIETLEDRELGTKPIMSLFLKYSMLTLVGQLAQGIMVILEGIVVGVGLGDYGFAVIALFMPLETLNLALGGFFGLGISTVVGMKLGEGDKEGARKAFAQGFWFTLIFMVVLSAGIYVCADPIATFLGSTPELHEDLVMMIKVFMFFYPACILGQVFTYVCRVDEKPGLASAVWTIAAGVAIIQLYLCLIVWKIGLLGSAIYYGISIGLFSVLIFYFLFNKKTALKIHMSDLKIDMKGIFGSLKIGLPTFLISASLFVYSIVINNMIAKTGTAMDIAAYGLINGYVLYVVTMFCASFQGGLSPIVSYNYGTKSYSRLREALIKSNIVNLIGIAILSLGCYLFANQIIALFAYGDTALIEAAGSATKTVIMLTFLGSMSGMLAVYYQSVEQVTKATVLGICRYIIFALPLVIILPSMQGMNGIWNAHPISDAITALFCVIVIVFEVKKLDKKIEKGN